MSRLAQIERDVLAVACDALSANGFDLPPRVYVGHVGEAVDGEQLRVLATRIQPQNPVGVRSVQTGVLRVPAFEVRVRLVRAWPVADSGVGRPKVPTVEQITDRATSLDDQADAILGGLEQLAREARWSDSLRRTASFGDCVPLPVAGGLAGWELTMIVGRV